MRQSKVLVAAMVGAVLAMTLSSSLARPPVRSFVGVPLHHVQLIRGVRHAPPPSQGPYREPYSGPYRHRRHHERGNYRLAPGPPYNDPEADASYEVDEKVVYDHDSRTNEPDQARNRYERQSGGGGGDDHEYVDYGAHTGHHGAFGWYADFPVLSKGHR